MRVLTFAAMLQDGKLELQPGFVVEGEPSHETGDLTVEAIGRGRHALATTCLRLHTPCGYRAGDKAQAAFGLVAFPERSSGLRVSLDGQVVLEQSADRDDLKVELDWPASLSGAESVRWRASTKDCLASLGYSSDGGKTWTPIALPGPSDTIAIDARTLPGGRKCLLELVATDGFHTVRMRSGAYEVERKGWVLRILAPAEGSKLPTGRPAQLAAQGWHMEERRAGFDDIEWRSSAGGGLGTGARVLTALDPGEHTITATMYGVTAEVAVTVA